MSRQRSLELKRKSALIYFSKYVRPPEGYFFLEAIPKEVFGLHPVKGGYPFRHRCLTHKKKHEKRKNRRKLIMAKKENFQEYVTRTQNEIVRIES